MKHLYCGRLTEVVLTDITAEVTALDVRETVEAQHIFAVDTTDVTAHVLSEIAERYPTAQKTFITTEQDIAHTGWDVVVVPIMSLPTIQAVLEG